MDNIFTWVIIIAIILWVIKTRNAFEELRLDIKDAQSKIKVYKENRAACLNDALSIAKRGRIGEVEGIARLTADDKHDQLLALAEKYPVLQSIPSYASAMEKSFGLNQEITATRDILNGNTTEYNKAINSFPGLIVAKIFGYKEAKLIEEENLAETLHLNTRDVDFDRF